MRKAIITLVAMFMALASNGQDTFDILEENTLGEGNTWVWADKRNNVFVSGYGSECALGRVNFKGKHSLFATMPDSAAVRGMCADGNGGMLVATDGCDILGLTKEGVVVVGHVPAEPCCLVRNITGDIYVGGVDGSIVRLGADGLSERVAEGVGQIVGLEVSPDGKRMYVSDNKQIRLLLFDIMASGRLDNERVLLRFHDHGMGDVACDRYGNIYIARPGKGRVVVATSAGVVLKEVATFGKEPVGLSVNFLNTACVVSLRDRRNIECIVFTNVFGESRY